MQKQKLVRIVLTFNEMKVASTLVIFAVLLLPIRAALGQTPSIEELTNGVPRLRPSEPNVDSFAFKFWTKAPFDVPFETTVIWQKDTTTGLLTTAGEDQIPVWMLQGTTSTYFDVCEGVVILGQNARPRFELGVRNGQLAMEYGVGTDDSWEIDVNFLSLLDRDEIRNGTLKRSNDGHYVVESKPYGNGLQTAAIFSGEKPHGIRQLEIRRRGQEEPIFRISEIQFNVEVSNSWHPITHDSEIPSGLTRLSIKELEGRESVSNVMKIVWRIQLGHAAQRVEKWRIHPLLEGVEWQTTNEHCARLKELYTLIIRR